jgi:hypothetical protein
VSTARAKSTYAQYPQERPADALRYLILMVALLLDPAAAPRARHLIGPARQTVPQLKGLAK